MLIKSCFLVYLFIGLASFKIHASANFVSQYYVDSLIDNALLEFNSLSDPSNSQTHESVLQNAKKAALKLRSIAKNDIHQKYILSKLGELENQIYLEEHELLLEKNQWMQKRSNQIIADFNKEIGVDRPDFNLLNDLQNKLSETDSTASSQMARSINKQAESFRKILPDLIEQKMEENNFDIAYKELSYCRIHAKSIGFTKSDIARLEASLVSRSSIAESLRLIKVGFDSLKTYLDGAHFKDARRFESVIKDQLDYTKQEMLSIEWKRYFVNWQFSVKKINSKEDSCIQIAEKMLKNGNVLETGYLLDSLSKSGVLPEKIAIVNKKLLNKIIIQTQNDASSNLFAFDADTGDAYPVFKDLIFAAKTRVLAERDSVSKEKEENTTLTQVAEIRHKHFLLSQETQQKRLNVRNNSEYDKAYDELVAIYIYIEKGSLDQARKRLQKVRKLLENNFPKQDLLELDSLLSNSSTPVDSAQTPR
jgi:hypothetical protein